MFAYVQTVLGVPASIKCNVLVGRSLGVLLVGLRHVYQHRGSIKIGDSTRRARHFHCIRRYVRNRVILWYYQRVS